VETMAGTNLTALLEDLFGANGVLQPCEALHYLQILLNEHVTK
jgi:hypothetical protein